MATFRKLEDEVSLLMDVCYFTQSALFMAVIATINLNFRELENN